MALLRLFLAYFISLNTPFAPSLVHRMYENSLNYEDAQSDPY